MLARGKQQTFIHRFFLTLPPPLQKNPRQTRPTSYSHVDTCVGVSLASPQINAGDEGLKVGEIINVGST